MEQSWYKSSRKWRNAMTEQTPTATAEAPETRELQTLATQGRAQRPGRIAREVEDCLSIGAAPAEETRAHRRMATAAALADIGPNDEVESMLTSQLLTVHGMAMDCVRSARDPAKEEELRLAYLGHAGRLLSLYARQVGRLENRRDWSQARAQEAALLLEQADRRAAEKRARRMTNRILDELVAEAQENGEDLIGESTWFPKERKAARPEPDESEADESEPDEWESDESEPDEGAPNEGAP
jgi:hypothetical protein